MDCHDHWHAALDNYNEPDGFRLALNSLIQALRNVTWVLQKQKADLPNFGTWYPEWQASVKDDVVMRWVVRARNRIVKESDLELHSSARVRLETDWLNATESTYVVPPRWTPSDIGRMLAAKGVLSLPSGEALLSVQRRWVDRELPERELLDACADAYEHLRRVVRLAHEEAGVDECDMPTRKRECIDGDLSLPFDCNWFEGEVRTLHLDPSTFAAYRPRRGSLPDNLPIPSHAAALKDLPQVDFLGGPLTAVPGLYELAKAFLRVDEGLIPAVWFYRDDKVVDMQLMMHPDQAAKRLSMAQVATRVKLLNADGILMLSEAWVAPSPKREQFRTGDFYPPRYHPDRQDAIHAFAVTADGAARSLMGLYRRDGDQVEFFEPQEDHEMGFAPFLQGVLDVWGVANGDADSIIEGYSEEDQEPSLSDDSEA